MSPDPRSTPAQAARARVERLARLYDGVVDLPIIGRRVGLDSLIGLIPGVGDFAGLLLGAHVLYEAQRAGAPKALLRTMLRNVATDAVLGVVPVLGDVFDFAYRSNLRNVKLLLRYLNEQERKPGQA